MSFNLPRDNPSDTLNPNYHHIDKLINIVFDHYEITKELSVSGSPNGQINAGDCIDLLVYVKNTGNYVANSVRGTIKTNSNYITYGYGTYGEELIFSEGTDPNNYPDHISPNTQGIAFESKYYTDVVYSINFQVSNTVPSNTNIPFTIEMKDKLNQQWSTSFQITVY